MSPDLLALARAYAGLHRFHWQPGMLTHEGYRLLRPRGDLWVCGAHDARGMGHMLGVRALHLRGSFPDLTDDATGGILLCHLPPGWLVYQRAHDGRWEVGRPDGEHRQEGSTLAEACARVAVALGRAA